MDELIDIVANVGFPMAVAIYLLIRVEVKLSQLTTAIYELREAIIILPGSLTARENHSAEASGTGAPKKYPTVKTYADN